MSNSEHVSHNQAHYDSVTDAWTYVLGSNLHYGFFDPEVSSLEQATDRLVWEMADFGNVGEIGENILDVGCGIGHPAFLLHKKYGCRVTGITISARGIQLGRERAAHLGVEEAVVFKEADAQDNKLESDSFDLLWQMESSHLIHDKLRLFRENYRVLRPGGGLVLCDLFLKRTFSVADIYNYRAELAKLEGSFGKAKMATMLEYRDTLDQCGFGEIEMWDVSDQVKPTLRAWKENVDLHRHSIERFLSPGDIEDFVESCDIVEDFFARDLMGYGMIRAGKPPGES